MSLEVAVAAILVVAVVAAWAKYAYWRVLPEYAAIPHVPPELLVGSVRQMGLLSGRSIGEGVAKLHQQLGQPPMMQLWFGKHHFITLHDPELHKALFSHHTVFLVRPRCMHTGRIRVVRCILLTSLRSSSVCSRALRRCWRVC
jgi:hypothetical protein